MYEKVLRTGIKLSDDFWYEVRQDGLWRVLATSDEDGRLTPVEGAQEELVRELDLHLDHRHHHFVDNDGDVSRYRLIPAARKSPPRCLAPLRDAAPSSTVTSSPNRFWLLESDDFEIDLEAAPDETGEWAYQALASDLTAGDIAFIWLNKPYHCIVAIAAIETVTRSDENATIEMRYLTHALEAPMYQDDLAKLGAFAGTKLLAANASGQAQLSAWQSVQLIESLRHTNPAITPLLDRWDDDLQRKVAGQSPPLAPEPVLDPKVTHPENFLSANVIEPGREYRVLSLHPAWAWSVFFAGKNVENRSWSTAYRGTILIHASSKKYTGKALEEARTEISKASGLPLDKIPMDFPRTQMLGLVDVIDCVSDSQSPWANDGDEHWILTHPRALEEPVLNINGKLQLWRWTLER